MFKQYIKRILLFLGLFVLPIIGNWVFLKQSGELMPFDEIAKVQIKQDFVAGLATRNQGYHYKMALYQQIKPEILVLGSSRVMEFRQPFFSQSMVNVGGSMSSVQEGFSFLKQAVATHRPKVVILGVDYWWFNQQLVYPAKHLQPPQYNNHVSLRDYLRPYQWLWEHKLTWSDYFQQMIKGYSPQKAIGVDGCLNQNGFLADGSYVYTKVVTGKEASVDEFFNYSIERMRHNNSTHNGQVEVNTTNFGYLLELIDFIRDHDINLHIFIPPVAPTILTSIETLQDEYTYINAVFEQMDQSGIQYYNYHDPRILDSSDCEFVDGVHGGDVLYAKILLDMLEQDNNLKPYLNVRKLTDVRSNFSGLAMLPSPIMQGLTEIDFLKIGCDKQRIS